MVVTVVCICVCISMVYVYFNCNCVDTRWQQYSTHLHTNSTQNTENGTYATIKKNENVRAVRRLCELYPGICLTTEVKALWYYEYFLCKFWEVVGRPYSAFTFRYLKSNSQLRIPIFWCTNNQNFVAILTAWRWGYCAFTKHRDPIIQWRSVASQIYSAFEKSLCT
jgi:hypothetical protein